MGSPFRELFEWILTARCIDIVEEEFAARGEAFFQVSSSGHEGSALLQRHLTADDWLHCHYRDKALMIARGVPPEMFFNSLLCNGASHSAGRQMSAHMCDPALRLLSIVGPVGNNALQAVGIAHAVKRRAGNPLVLCSFGDGTSQEGEVLEAIAEVVRWQLPVLFWVHDNGYSISTKTRGKTFFSTPRGDADEFYGMKLHRLDGRDLVACDREVGRIVADMRADRSPAVVVFQVERLVNHTNADDEAVYRSDVELSFALCGGEPVLALLNRLVADGTPRDELDALPARVMKRVRDAAAAASAQAPPRACPTAKRPIDPRLESADGEYRGTTGGTRLTMREAIGRTLRHHLANDSRVTLYGQDIEDPKGDVFRVTAGLSSEFPGRVVNAPLSESTIVGTAIGRALAGERPVAFIQFADFLPLAFNQIACELGSMYWRTAGGWECPVVVMVPCGAYRPGLGPFHAQTFESVAAHTPGIDVVMPSDAADAAGALNAAFASGRPTIVFYPKSRLNDPDGTTSADDVARHLVPIGRSRRTRSGRDLTIVGWGSTVRLCEGAADALAAAGRTADVIDLRWLSPWDREAVCESAGRTGRVLVVHEDNETCGFGAEVLAVVAERAGGRVVARRVARPDTYVPCNFSNQLEVLPSFKRVLEAAADMLDLDLVWEAQRHEQAGTFEVQAVGSSPSDDSVVVAELKVAPGGSVAVGDVLASLECNKALFELTSPVAGVVERLWAEPGQTVRVGAPLLTVKTEGAGGARRQQVREETGTPRLTPRPARPQRARLVAADDDGAACRPVGLSQTCVAEGRLTLTNEDLVRRFPQQTEEGIFTRTGIRTRRRLAEDETGVLLAARAAAEALEQARLTLPDIDLVICSTSTAERVCPSTACLVLNELYKKFGPVEIPAYDISAACSGYLYALGQAFDFLQTRPQSRVLVLTAEAMSRVVDPNDFDTAILFGDAATATIVYGANHIGKSLARLHRPVLLGRGEDGSILSVPAPGGESFVKMDGRKVFAEAVRSMHGALKRACDDAGIAVGDLDLIVPHQANARIIEAVRQRLGPAARVANDVELRGNTSSSTIPLVLHDLLSRPDAPETIGLCAFGAGFTYGAAVLRKEGSE